MNNICKYAPPNSRVYVNLEETKDEVTMTFRNISRYPLNITSDELMERFVRATAPEIPKAMVLDCRLQAA